MLDVFHQQQKSHRMIVSNLNHLQIKFCVQNQHEFELTKISFIGTLFKVWFIQNSDLFRVQVRQVSLYIRYY
jgi:hypothetical protein